MRMLRLPKFLWVALIIIGGVGGAVFFQLRSYESQWQPALSVVDRDRLFELIRDNSHDLEQQKDFTTIQSEMEIKILRPFASPELVIVNFNTKSLCGIAGCLYAVYQTDKPAAPLFQWLLNPALPKATPLFSTTGDCLVVNQYQQAKNQMATMKYCKSGKSYAERDKSFNDISTQ
jgi:hypothetical protein